MQVNDENGFDLPLEELQDMLGQFLGEKGKNLNVLQDLQNLQHTLIQREARRLQAKLPADHPRRQHIEARAKTSATLSQDIAEQAGLARVKMPDIAEDDAVIQGRVLDEKQRGLQMVKVTLEDVQGNTISDLGGLETQPGGFFAIKATPDLIAKAQKVEGGVFLTVRNRHGDVMQRVTEPVTLEKGRQSFVDVPVKRAAASRRPPTTPPPPKPRKEADTWVVRGIVADEEGNGIEGLMVTALDKDVRFDDYLGAALTAPNGSFVIAYDIREFKEGEEQGVDLFVRVVDSEGNVLFSSEDSIRYDAGRDETFEITIERPDKESGRKKKK